MRRRIRNSLLLLLFVSGKVLAQNNSAVLSPHNFLKQVEEYHPVARQTSLQVGQSVASVLASRGIFDPVIDFQKDAKRLSGDRYYDHNNPEIKLFTPLGITLKAGVENNIGKYLNPELTNGVLSYAGVEIPVLQGLLIDKKRAALRQAEIMVNQTEEKRRAILNDLYLNAITDYWYWAAAYRELQIIDQNLEIALQRLELTRVLFTNGEKAAADTTEAAGQVLALQLQQSAAVQEFQKAGVNLSQYLWGENMEPYLLAETTIPDVGLLLALPQIQQVNTLTDNLSQHPAIRTLDYQFSVLQVEQRLKRQNLLPELKIKANLLSKDYFSFENNINPYLTNNYKFGLSFHVPLFLRESRGELQKTNLKMEETQWKQKQKNWELETKIIQYQTELQNLRNQTNLAGSLIDNYQQMLDIEELRFSQGESSLFLINSRQNKLIDSYMKQVQLQIKYLQTWFKQQWAAGLLNS